jgi:hypothetical protein
MSLVSRGVRWALTVGGRRPTRRWSAVQWARGAAWEPAPPAKRAHLLRVFAERGHDTLIESGTFRGGTVAAFAPHARRIVSVELDRALYEFCADRFAGDDHIDIRHGDATELVPQAVAEVGRPALVFLDGHFSGPGTALGDELEPAATILDRLGAVAPPGTTVIVDDLRLFGVASDYPPLEVLTATAHAAFPDARQRIGLDCLVIET